MTDQPEPEQGPQIMIEPGHMAGVWATWALVSHSPYEFTIDFVRQVLRVGRRVPLGDYSLE